jgi:hypothetical protein
MYRKRRSTSLLHAKKVLDYNNSPILFPTPVGKRKTKGK